MEALHRYFNARYRERTVLRNGVRVVLRLLRPTDKEGLVHGLQHMSPQSRYFRFFCNKAQFSADELRYLTELDHESHVAIAAMRDQPDKRGEGVGIARLVRLPDEPKVAEAAVAVVDDMQRNGLGRLLFMRIAAAARERGIERIRAEVLAQNVAVRTIIQKLAPDAHWTHEGSSVFVEARLPDVSPTAGPEMASDQGAGYRLLTLVAGDALAIRAPSGRPPASRPSPATPSGSADGSKPGEAGPPASRRPQR